MTDLPRRRILLVEDDSETRDAIADVLACAGYEIRTAGDGPAALELARRFAPEVVLCDIGLPGMDGYSVARELRRLPQGTSMTLAALTGYAEEDDRAAARRAGFDAFLSKPLGGDSLRAFIAGLSSAGPEAARAGAGAAA